MVFWTSVLWISIFSLFRFLQKILFFHITTIFCKWRNVPYGGPIHIYNVIEYYHITCRGSSICIYRSPLDLHHTMIWYCMVSNDAKKIVMSRCDVKWHVIVVFQGIFSCYRHAVLLRFLYWCPCMCLKISFRRKSFQRMTMPGCLLFSPRRWRCEGCPLFFFFPLLIFL